MRIKAFLLLLCIASSLLLFAQPRQGKARLDSLLAEVPKMKEDTAGVKLMSDLSAEYMAINPEEGVRWAMKELTLARQTGPEAKIMNAYNDLGNSYANKGAYPQAMEAFFKSLRMAEEGKDSAFAGIVSGNIGLVYYYQQHYDKALECYFRSLKTAEARADQEVVLTMLGNIGSVYSDEENFSEALEYQTKALRLAEEMGDQSQINIQNGNIGDTYIDLKQYPVALAYCFRALRVAGGIGDLQGVAVTLGSIGTAYYEIAVDGPEPKPDSLVPASRDVNLFKAVDYLRRSVAACREAHYPEDIPHSADYLSKALARQGDYKGALLAYKLGKGVQDSLYNLTNSKAITNLETRRAVELKDKDILIARLKKRNERILSVSGFAVLLLVMTILFRSYRRQQRSNILLSKEKKRSDDLLLNILPAEVAEELKDKGASAAKQYEEVSVLFTDFVNFTSTAESLSPHALVQELHACFSAFDAIIERNGLEKIKTIGDAYMAVCGLPVADERHAQRTVQAALEIRDFMARRLSFPIRIGVNSGPVVAGIVGVKKFAYDIWGDNVNTAARMESASEPGQINISQTTYDLVKNKYHCTPRGKIAVKGKGEVEMYFVAPLVQ